LGATLENRDGMVTIPLLSVALLAMIMGTEGGRRGGPRALAQVHFLYHRRYVIVLFQAALLTVTYYCSFLLRFDFRLIDPYRTTCLVTLPLILLIKLPAFYYFRLFSGWWRYVGMSDLLDIIKAAAVSAPLVCAGVYVFHGFGDYPRSVFVIDAILTVFLVGGTRFAVRAYYESARLHLSHANTLIVGAGRAGNAVVRELKENEKLEYNPVGIVDDDPTKQGLRIQGVPVMGSTLELPRLIAKHDVAHILIAIPSATGRQMQKIIERCKESNVDFRTLPALADIIDGTVSFGSMRGVRLEDLLAREPVRLDLSMIRSKFEGKCVFITGAGGSIGSELSRQVARFNPGRLVLFDRSESDLFKIDLELSGSSAKLDCVPVVGDILDVSRLREVFQTHRPRSVFHAAAFKHVPMMESNCFQAVTNNIFGTYNVALIARECGVEDFVMISSDKAVNPGNIMGVTKRVAELLILGLQRDTTRFVSVRFGNVLGSKGSVIPIFEQQIANRKAITITHPEAKRYFMTIPEAAQLVLQASTMGKGGEVFVLDMGEPVKVVDLARTLIRLSGLEPERDIPIVFTGLRPGEKLFEELQLNGEGIKPTSHQKIRVLDGGEVGFELVGKWLEQLTAIVDSRNVHSLVAKLKEIVPEYTPSKEILSLCEVDRFDRLVSYGRARAELKPD
jgi:FlaA1/EpsC-like NDP-sugar epimerase